MSVLAIFGDVCVGLIIFGTPGATFAYFLNHRYKMKVLEAKTRAPSPSADAETIAALEVRIAQLEDQVAWWARLMGDGQGSKVRVSNSVPTSSTGNEDERALAPGSAKPQRAF